MCTATLRVHFGMLVTGGWLHASIAPVSAMWNSAGLQNASLKWLHASSGSTPYRSRRVKGSKK